MNSERVTLNDYKFDRYKKHNILKVNYGEILRDPQSFYQECLFAAHEVANEARDKSIFIAVSGGIDSECTLQSFVDSGIPVQPIFLRFKKDLNIHEYKWAKKICKKRGVELLEVHFDIYDFLTSGGHLEYGELTGVRSPQIAALLWLADHIYQLGGFFVFSGDAVLGRLKKNIFQDIQNIDFTLSKIVDFYLGPSGALMAFERLKSHRGAVGVSSFLSLTSYQVASSLTLIDPPSFDNLNAEINLRLRKKALERITYYRQLEKIAILKRALFSKVGFSIEEREMKYTGYELIHENEAKDHAELGLSHQRIVGLNRFNEKFRKPLEEMNPSEYIHSFSFGKRQQKYIESFYKNYLNSPSYIKQPYIYQ